MKNIILNLILFFLLNLGLMPSVSLAIIPKSPKNLSKISITVPAASTPKSQDNVNKKTTKENKEVKSSVKYKIAGGAAVVVILGLLFYKLYVPPKYTSTPYTATSVYTLAPMPASVGLVAQGSTSLQGDRDQSDDGSVFSENDDRSFVNESAQSVGSIAPPHPIDADLAEGIVPFTYDIDLDAEAIRAREALGHQEALAHFNADLNIQMHRMILGGFRFAVMLQLFWALRGFVGVTNAAHFIAIYNLIKANNWVAYNAYMRALCGYPLMPIQAPFQIYLPFERLDLKPDYLILPLFLALVWKLYSGV